MPIRKHYFLKRGIDGRFEMDIKSWLRVGMILIVFLTQGGCARSEQVDIVTQSSVTAHLTANLLSGESIDLGSEVVSVEIHKTQTVKNGKVISEDGCHLSFPGQDENFSVDLSVVGLNGKALELERKVNAVLDEMGGGPYRFTHNPANIDSCEETDIYATISLSVYSEDRSGPGFLTYKRQYSESDEVYLNVPVNLYDTILTSTIENSTIDWLIIEYPDIEVVGGYVVTLEDPYEAIQWLKDQESFIENVYGKDTETVTNEGKMTLDHSRQIEVGTGYYKCPRVAPFCDREEVTKPYWLVDIEEIEVHVGTLKLVP